MQSLEGFEYLISETYLNPFAVVSHSEFPEAPLRCCTYLDLCFGAIATIVNCVGNEVLEDQRQLAEFQPYGDVPS